MSDTFFKKEALQAMSHEERGQLAACMKVTVDYVVNLSREDDVNDHEPWSTQSWWPHVSDDFKQGWADYMEE